MYTFLSLRLLVNYSFLGSHYDTVSLEIYSRYFFVENPDLSSLSCTSLFILHYGKYCQALLTKDKNIKKKRKEKDRRGRRRRRRTRKKEKRSRSTVFHEEYILSAASKRPITMYLLLNKLRLHSTFILRYT